MTELYPPITQVPEKELPGKWVPPLAPEPKPPKRDSEAPPKHKTPKWVPPKKKERSTNR